jgi:hypothetical protein
VSGAPTGGNAQAATAAPAIKGVAEASKSDRAPADKATAGKKLADDSRNVVKSNPSQAAGAPAASSKALPAQIAADDAPRTQAIQDLQTAQATDQLQAAGQTSEGEWRFRGRAFVLPITPELFAMQADRPEPAGAEAGEQQRWEGANFAAPAAENSVANDTAAKDTAAKDTVAKDSAAKDTDRKESNAEGLAIRQREAARQPESDIVQQDGDSPADRPVAQTADPQSGRADRKLNQLAEPAANAPLTKSKAPALPRSQASPPNFVPPDAQPAAPAKPKPAEANRPAPSDRRGQLPATTPAAPAPPAPAARALPTAPQNPARAGAPSDGKALPKAMDRQSDRQRQPAKEKQQAAQGEQKSLVQPQLDPLRQQSRSQVRLHAQAAGDDATIKQHVEDDKSNLAGAGIQAGQMFDVPAAGAAREPRYVLFLVRVVDPAASPAAGQAAQEAAAESAEINAGLGGQQSTESKPAEASKAGVAAPQQVQPAPAKAPPAPAKSPRAPARSPAARQPNKR